MLIISVIFNVAAFITIFNLTRGGERMVDMYVALVIAGRRNINTVPVKFQTDVQADLTALGLDGHGNPITQVTE